ncbi:LAFE_0C06480g1_1 [Lachancea fermentati]|uniref:LAFE_0C06480g1_1 n=1 Tax=Lachancea fermentati TaxID=4955 RepID=A0A1G4M9K4_LACFM|nr:LAFE_0C06480g1_1 [Lachancea fermentati]
MSVPENALDSPNLLKRKKEDCQEEFLEAEIKRVALDDTEEAANSNEETKDYIHLRMLCLVKQASMVVGPGGEKISKMKSETNTRINVSDNIRGVPERVIFIRGRCEDVAKVFGMVVRAINDEKDEKSNENSASIAINLLIPHHMMGCVIGRQGSRLREIEELSAAKLIAGPQTLPMSNDRILCITGVADAIHIATYYVGQTILNHKSTFASKKCIFYQPNLLHSVLVNSYGVSFQHQQQHQYHPGEKNKKRLQRVAPPSDFGYGFTSVSPHAAFTSPLPVNNVRIADGIATATMPATITSQLSLIQQEIYIDDNFVGNVIGKGGRHINSIKETTGCSIQIDDPIEGRTERKIVIRGTPIGSQTAILLINNKIEIDRRNKEVSGKRV